MKGKLFYTCIFLLIITKTIAQDNSNYFFNEYQVSINRTNLEDNNTEDRIGFGIGTYHSFFEHRVFNIIFGLEYNRTSQFKKFIHESRFQYATNLTYNMNSFSIPLGFRFNFGSQIKVFVESGGYSDLLFYANRKGTQTTTIIDGLNVKIIETEIDESVKLSSSVGIYFGIGIRIPISKYEIVIKPEYKYGLTDLYSYQQDILNRYFRLNIGLKI